MAYYFYIIPSEMDSSFYVGTTNNLIDRIARHNQGRSKYTNSRCPWHLVYHEKYPDRPSAMKRKYAIKRKKSRGYIEAFFP
ncbi:MAG: GIY-YIG nuclease family protein [Deltaproteobacteria bacterium]|nr:GIY-YIG nuclease family protein [Deltaproteobacteria bacterium]